MSNTAHQSQLTIIERLKASKPIASLQSYASLWRQADIVVDVEAPRNFSVDFSLPGRIRGAFGRVLMDNREFDGVAEELFNLCFDEAANWRRVLPDLPRPYALTTSKAVFGFRLKFKFFGFISARAPQASNYLTKALARGIAVAEQSRVRSSLQIKSMTIKRIDGIAPTPAAARWICLVFNSPASVLQGQRMLLQADNLAASIVRRAVRLSAWQDLALDADVLLGASDEMTWTMFTRGRNSSSRGSTRQRRGRLTIEGELVTLVGEGASCVLPTLVRIGELAQGGARTAFGHGDFRAFIS